MKLMIDKMRADFALVIAGRRTAGIWVEGDEADAGRAIAKLVSDRDEEGLLMWSRWLARLALLDLLGFSELTQPSAENRQCSECDRFGAPEDKDAQCHGRAALVRLYGRAHPLALLPSDSATSCARFVKREGA